MRIQRFVAPSPCRWRPPSCLQLALLHLGGTEQLEVTPLKPLSGLGVAHAETAAGRGLTVGRSSRWLCSEARNNQIDADATAVAQFRANAHCATSGAFYLRRTLSGCQPGWPMLDQLRACNQFSLRGGPAPGPSQAPLTCSLEAGLTLGTTRGLRHRLILTARDAPICWSGGRAAWAQASLRGAGRAWA